MYPDMSITFKCKEARVDTFPYYYRPHYDQHGFCLGDFSTLVRNFIGTLDFKSLILLCYRYLTTFDRGTAVKDIDAWIRSLNPDFETVIAPVLKAVDFEPSWIYIQSLKDNVLTVVCESTSSKSVLCYDLVKKEVYIP